jgi:hypothetical protein
MMATRVNSSDALRVGTDAIAFPPAVVVVIVGTVALARSSFDLRSVESRLCKRAAATSEAIFDGDGIVLS